MRICLKAFSCIMRCVENTIECYENRNKVIVFNIYYVMYSVVLQLFHSGQPILFRWDHYC